jgi:polyphosphate kinase
VLAIKMTLYRVGRNAPVVKALLDAREEGKQVAVLVELKARFDEEMNIEWARALENEGVHVVYGFSSLKTHSKVLLVVRRENDKLIRYTHISTGNYNTLTASQYTDIGLLTSDADIGADATNLFNFLTGYSQQDDFKRLIVAPLNLRECMLEMIHREIANKQKGRDAAIILKVNSLTDTELIDRLYDASKAGVSVDLIVRGICALRPGIKGLSENIRVRSIVGRFLEHSRIFYFANGGEDFEIFISSADWMHRNLDRRVEVTLPILDSDIKQYLFENVLKVYLEDNVNARLLKPDGTYRKIPIGKSKSVNSQMAFVGQIPTN